MPVIQQLGDDQVGNTYFSQVDFMLTSNASPVVPTIVKLDVVIEEVSASTHTYGVGLFISNPVPGRYTADIVLTQAGLWKFHWYTQDALPATTPFGYLRVLDDNP